MPTLHQPAAAAAASREVEWNPTCNFAAGQPSFPSDPAPLYALLSVGKLGHHRARHLLDYFFVLFLLLVSTRWHAGIKPIQSGRTANNRLFGGAPIIKELKKSREMGRKSWVKTAGVATAATTN